jgi:hypothetical protein
MNMLLQNFTHKMVYGCVILTMLLSLVPTPIEAYTFSDPHPASYSAPPTSYSQLSTGLYRVTITLRQPTDRARLDKLGIMVLGKAQHGLPHG